MATSLLTRRSFVKLAAVVGAAAGLATAPHQALAETGDGSASVSSDVKVVRTCCRACGKNECGVLVTVKDGRAIKVEGDAETAFHSMGN